ncbi:MAG: CBS domain-containing protein [Actinomycetota bacterium]
MKRVSEIMTPEPVTVIESDTLFHAARLMRDEDIGDVIVLDNTSARVKAIVTDRDMVIRAVADGQDPRETTLAAVATEELLTVSPDDAVDKAARIMRDRAVRRLPVVDEDGRAVGVVSLGDLALELDRRSALAEISAAPANN